MVDQKEKNLIALGIEYDGFPYCGWQRQKHCDSVQGALEKALSSIANQPIEVSCAGRTDTGVHATGQVAHFEYCTVENENRSLRTWMEGTNARLPNSISVTWSKYVDTSFHARFSALSRTYRYIILNNRSRHALLSNRVSQFIKPIDIQKLNSVTDLLLGEQDFSSVRAANCQSKSSHRNVSSLKACRKGDFILIEITANAFLYHMVRNIVGLLAAVGQGELTYTEVKKLLAAKDRTLAPATAPASGLYLTAVEYPEKFKIPSSENELWPWYQSPIKH